MIFSLGDISALSAWIGNLMNFDGWSISITIISVFSSLVSRMQILFGDCKVTFENPNFGWMFNEESFWLLLKNLYLNDFIKFYRSHSFGHFLVFLQGSGLELLFPTWLSNPTTIVLVQLFSVDIWCMDLPQPNSEISPSPYCDICQPHTNFRAFLKKKKNEIEVMKRDILRHEITSFDVPTDPLKWYEIQLECFEMKWRLNR
jgi:hypothetical protein